MLYSWQYIYKKNKIKIKIAFRIDVDGTENADC